MQESKPWHIHASVDGTASYYDHDTGEWVQVGSSVEAFRVCAERWPYTVPGDTFTRESMQISETDTSKRDS